MALKSVTVRPSAVAGRRSEFGSEIAILASQLIRTVIRFGVSYGSTKEKGKDFIPNGNWNELWWVAPASPTP